jgi:hypothetical protein
MWALFNHTPYGAERNWTRDKDGMHWWIVAVRATFDIMSTGELRLADEQVPPLLAPEYFGDPQKTSLKYDSDLLCVKPATDVLLVASAHAPGGRPASAVPVSLRVGNIRKQLVVHGDRVYRDNGQTTSSPVPFVTRPIRYELAFGGLDLSDPDPANQRIDERNPVGRGVAAHLNDRPAHSIEYPNGNASSAGPAGFGPIDPAWMPRRALAGTYDDRWAKNKAPLLPDDYNPAYALSSPVDQRLARPLEGGERFELINMTPEGRLLLELPRISLEFTSAFGRRREPHGSPRLVTVLIEPDARRLSVMWQSTIRVGAPDVDYLDATAIIEKGHAA